MPHTTTLECPGCPPLPALTFDTLGLIKVVEARDKHQGGVPKIGERWGEPDSSKSLMAVSIIDLKTQPLGSAEPFMQESKFLIHGNGKEKSATGFMFEKEMMKGLYLNQSPSKGVELDLRKIEGAV